MKFFRALVLAVLVPATALAWVIHVPNRLAPRLAATDTFLALSPWVTGDATREQLAVTADELAKSNAYVESVIYADLS